PDGCAILARNAFDAQSGALCPAKTVAASEPPTPPPAPGPGETPPACDGETRKLIAAVHSERDRSRSFVELTGVGSASQLVQEGDRIDDDEVFAIYPTAVHLKQSCGYYCSLSMFGELAQSGALPAFAPASGGASFKVQRALVESVLQDPGAGLGSIRVVPHSKDGRMVGAKLYGIRKDSPLHTLGLQNGDVLLAINGLEIATPDAALDAYSRLRSESNLSVSLERRGEPMTVDYAIE
ncbi:MAG TPA: PDZ domain-containing protein, partial [Polyangiales bacterium]|nr:PDZ domain-containing protein [Polyangiales bacterium]